MAKNSKTKRGIENIQTPKGTRDILPEESKIFKEIYEKAEHIASYYNFLPIQTPHIEKEDLFTTTLGETSDVVEKQMYTIKTKGGDRLVLRPEGTAPVMRAYLEHGMHTLPQPIMLYYLGAFFRHENPQKGRQREFNQFGLEMLGTTDEIADAIIIRTLSIILSEIGIPSHIVRINSIGDKECAPIYKKELISYLKKRVNSLCKDCKRRLKLNPLRILDCKEQKCREVVQDAPQIINFLCEECKRHFKNLLEYLDALNIPYILDNFLVRGLDYYSRTVFEIFEDKNQEENSDNTENSANAEDMSKIAIASGGRYDYLGNMLSGRTIPGMGGAIGIERVAMIIKNKTIATEKNIPKAYLIQLGDMAKRKSLNLLENLRKSGVVVHHSLSKDSLRGQLKSASNLKSEYALIIGQKEALENSIILRNMETGSQEIIPIPEIAERLKKLDQTN